jgi:hypothetical protein
METVKDLGEGFDDDLKGELARLAGERCHSGIVGRRGGEGGAGCHRPGQWVYPRQGPTTVPGLAPRGFCRGNAARDSMS